jgi:hypothetical protein
MTPFVAALASTAAAMIAALSSTIVSAGNAKRLSDPDRRRSAACLIENLWCQVRRLFEARTMGGSACQRRPRRSPTSQAGLPTNVGSPEFRVGKRSKKK